MRRWRCALRQLHERYLDKESIHDGFNPRHLSLSLPVQPLVTSADVDSDKISWPEDSNTGLKIAMAGIWSGSQQNRAWPDSIGFWDPQQPEPQPSPPSGSTPRSVDNCSIQGRSETGWRNAEISKVGNKDRRSPQRGSKASWPFEGAVINVALLVALLVALMEPWCSVQDLRK